jgi:hypothetical protein
MDMVDCGAREALSKLACIKQLHLLRCEFDQRNLAEAWNNMDAYEVAVASPGAAPDLQFGRFDPTIQILLYRLPLIKNLQPSIQLALRFFEPLGDFTTRLAVEILSFVSLESDVGMPSAIRPLGDAPFVISSPLCHALKSRSSSLLRATPPHTREVR